MQISGNNASLVHSLSDLWHSVPRRDLAFNVVNSTFQPDNEGYRQSLVMWGLAPVFILLVTLLIFLVYFCRRCCQKKEDSAKESHIRCLRSSAGVLAVITVLVVGVGFYGNRETEKGLDRVIHGADGVIIAVSSAQMEQAVEFWPELHESVLGVDHVFKLFEIFERWGAGRQAHADTASGAREMNNLFQQSESFVNSFRLLSEQLDRVDMTSAARNLRDLTDLAGYRWLTVTLLLTALLVLSLTLMFGIAKGSHHTLIIFSICSTIGVMFCWIFSGVHLTSSLAVGDFCASSDNPIIEAWPTLADDAVFSYFISCDTRQAPNPFKEPLVGAMDALHNSRSLVKEASQLVRDEDTSQLINVISDEIDIIWEAFTKLTALADCRSMRRGYTNGVIGLCERALPGLSLVFLSIAIIAVTMSCLILLSSFIWRHYSGQRKSQWQHATLTVESPTVADAEDDDAVFMTPSTDTDDPRSDYRLITRGNNNNNSSSHSNSNRRQREMLLMPRRHLTPPPAYNSDEFYRQYSDVSPSIYGIHDSTAEA